MRIGMGGYSDRIVQAINDNESRITVLEVEVQATQKKLDGMECWMLKHIDALETAVKVLRDAITECDRKAKPEKTEGYWCDDCQCWMTNWVTNADHDGHTIIWRTKPDARPVYCCPVCGEEMGAMQSGYLLCAPADDDHFIRITEAQAQKLCKEG